MNIKNTFAAPALIIIVMSFLLASRLIDPSLLGMHENPYLSMIVLQFMVFALPAIFFTRLRGFKSGRYSDGSNGSLRLNFFTAEHILFMIYVFVMLVSGTMIIRFLTAIVMPQTQFAVSASEYTSIYPDDIGGSLYAVLTFGIIPAVTEEFLFRSVIVSEYERNGVFCAVVMSSLMFAMIHLNIALMPTYFYSGIVLAFTVFVTNSVLASVCVHILNNILSLFGEPFFQKITGRTQNMALFMFIMVAVLLLSAALAFGEAQRIYYNRGVMNLPSPKIVHRSKHKASFTEALFSPPFLMLFVFYIIISVSLN